MFRNWGFLLGEIWVLLALAALLGLFVGWLIWGRLVANLRNQLSSCKGDLDACTRKCAELNNRPEPAPAAAPKAVTPQPAASKPAAKTESAKPKTLTAARDGKPDDLQLIKGIGPQMERLCNRLGFYHFDQIAGWSRSELNWVDDNLEGFKGRASRDEWVKQAKILAKGGSTEYSRR